VIENKTEVASIEATLRKLDEKAGLAAAIARERLGWRPTSLGRMLIILANTTNRRRVREHDRVLRAALPARAGELRAWVRHPRGPIAGILFVPVDRVVGTTQRVRSNPRIQSSRSCMDTQGRRGNRRCAARFDGFEPA
jgi:hypothetical protein